MFLNESSQIDKSQLPLPKADAPVAVIYNNMIQVQPGAVLND